MQGRAVAQFIYTMYKVRKAHGDKVILDDVTLSFLPGAKIGVVGPNGAGKSTVLRIMAGLDHASNGDARLDPGAKVGMLQRPERVVLLSAPQAFFGLALNGWVLASIIVVLTVTAWITVVQRVMYVYSQTTNRVGGEGRLQLAATERAPWLRRRRTASSR